MSKAQIYIINSKMGNGEQLPEIAMKNNDKRSGAKTKKRANPCETDEFRSRGLRIYIYGEAQIYIINSKMGNGEQLPRIAMKNDDTRSRAKTLKREPILVKLMC